MWAGSLSGPCFHLADTGHTAEKPAHLISMSLFYQKEMRLCSNSDTLFRDHQNLHQVLSQRECGSHSSPYVLRIKLKVIKVKLLAIKSKHQLGHAIHTGRCSHNWTTFLWFSVLLSKSSSTSNADTTTQRLETFIFLSEGMILITNIILLYVSNTSALSQSWSHSKTQACHYASKGAIRVTLILRLPNITVTFFPPASDSLCKSTRTPNTRLASIL